MFYFMCVYWAYVIVLAFYERGGFSGLRLQRPRMMEIPLWSGRLICSPFIQYPMNLSSTLSDLVILLFLCASWHIDLTPSFTSHILPLHFSETHALENLFRIAPSLSR